MLTEWQVRGTTIPCRQIEWFTRAPCCGCEIVPINRVRDWDACDCRCHETSRQLAGVRKAST